tara:strand:- start:44 stop:265 length:222 start_codon:yes stop_codon:yes gene_type:complete
VAIIEKVTIEGAKDYQNLYGMLNSALRGYYKETLETSQGTEALEKTISEEFDKFATRYFDLGREYEQEKINGK